MKVLVLGGSGWVGHYVVRDFVKAGFEVTSASRGVTRQTFEECVSGVREVHLDKDDENAMKELLAERFEIIIDTVPHEKAIEHIHKYAKGLRHYLHCSSTGGYAPLPFIPCNETAPYRGFAGGGWLQKCVVDRQVMNLFLNHGFPATVIRPCYITGGADKLPLDNLGGRRPDFIPNVLAEKTLEVPDNGLALLQPIHVEDLAHSFLCAVRHRRSIGEIYNICLDHALTLNDYLALTADSLEREVHLEHVPLAELLERHPEDPVGLRFLASHMCFSIEKARTEIGYEPMHTPEEAIAETARKIAAKLAK